MKLVLRMVVGLSPGYFVLDGDPAPPQFLAHFYCGQPAGCIKMPLCTDVGLSPGDCVRWRPTPPPQKGGRDPKIFGPCLLWPNGWMDQVHIVLDGDTTPLPQKRGQRSPQFSAHLYCDQTAGCIKVPLGMEVGLSRGDCGLDGDPVPYPKRGGAPPDFRPTSIVAKRLHGSRRHLVRK